MNKTEIKNATNNVLIMELIKTNEDIGWNCRRDRGVKGLVKYLYNIGDELIKRGLLTREDLENLWCDDE